MKRRVVCLALTACGPHSDGDAAHDSTATTSTTGAAADSGSGSGTASSSTADVPATGGEVGAGIIDEPDAGGDACDVWAQDCPPGEKCMPWANDGGGGWNSLRCSPVADSPNDVGEPCSVVGSAVSGIDDCTFGAMCWGVDPETQTGECVAMCHGSEAHPLCLDPCDLCNILGEAVLVLCLPGCDPIAQACAEGQACIATQDTFACVPDASGKNGAIGDACEFINTCDPGNFCADAAAVPACEASSGCCAPFCDAAGPDTCGSLLLGTSCIPWFAEGQAPGQCIGPDTVGACLLEPP